MSSRQILMHHYLLYLTNVMLECFALAETHIPFFILILDSKSLLLLLGHTLSLCNVVPYRLHYSICKPKNWVTIFQRLNSHHKGDYSMCFFLKYRPSCKVRLINTIKLHLGFCCCWKNLITCPNRIWEISIAIDYDL